MRRSWANTDVVRMESGSIPHQQRKKPGIRHALNYVMAAKAVKYGSIYINLVPPSPSIKSIASPHTRTLSISKFLIDEDFFPNDHLRATTLFSQASIHNSNHAFPHLYQLPRLLRHSHGKSFSLSLSSPSLYSLTI